MKFLYFLLLFFAFPLSAQTTFESPYVFEGKTLQFEIPKGFKLAKSLSDERFEIYALDTAGLDIREDMEEWQVPKGVFQICLPNSLLEGESLWVFGENLDYMYLGSIYIELKADPVRSMRDNCPFVRAKFNFEGDWVMLDHINISMIEFGECVFLIGTFNEYSKDTGLMNFLDEALSASISIVETEKENALEEWDDEFTDWNYSPEESFEEEDYVRSNITSGQLKFRKESSAYWNDAYPEDCLRMFDYGAIDKQIQGSVMLFSAGVETDSLSDTEISTLLPYLYSEYQIDSIQPVGTVTGEYFTFKKYTVSGDARTTKFIKYIYTAPFEGELLIIVVKRGEYTTNSFAISFEPFVKSLYPIIWNKNGPPPTVRQ